MKDFYREFIREIKNYSDKELQVFETFVNEFKWPQRSAIPKSIGLEAIVFADTHGYFAQRNRVEELIYRHPGYEVCILLGDVAYQDIDMILQYVPEEKIISVLGNHDNLDLLRHFGLADLNGRTVDYGGIKFAGIGGSHRYKRGNNWPMMSQYESLELSLDMIEMQEVADILITHDKGFTTAEYDIAHTGLVGISAYINQIKPQYHLHGHMHKNYRSEYKNGTTEICVYGAKHLIL